MAGTGFCPDVAELPLWDDEPPCAASGDSGPCCGRVAERARFRCRCGVGAGFVCGFHFRVISAGLVSCLDCGDHIELIEVL